MGLNLDRILCWLWRKTLHSCLTSCTWLSKDFHWHKPWPWHLHGPYQNAQAQLIDSILKQGQPGKHWWSNFCKRHPWLTLHRSDKLDHSRVECLNPVVGEYFELLEKVLAGRGLRNAPRQISNCDETFSRQRKGCHPQEYQECIFSGCWHITMLWAVSAAGFPLPPMIIYPNGFPGGAYTFQGSDDALYGKSDFGWVEGELFFQWVKKIFLKFAVPQWPVILFIDGHKSHTNNAGCGGLGPR